MHIRTSKLMVLILLFMLASPFACAPTRGVSVTTEAYGEVDAAGVTRSFADPTPAGAEITRIDVTTEMLPWWTNEAYGDEWFLLEGTCIGEVTTPGSSDWVPQSFTYTMGDNGLHDTPPLVFVKDGENALTIESYWNPLEVDEVTLMFSYEIADGTDSGTDTGAATDSGE